MLKFSEVIEIFSETLIFSKQPVRLPFTCISLAYHDMYICNLDIYMYLFYLFCSGLLIFR